MDAAHLAIAAGATFVGRGFAGRPHELAELIVEGIRWPGFAFVEVLSPCMAFRPEEFGWKKLVHPATNVVENDRAAAYAAALADDGFSLGLLFKDHGAAPADHPSPTTSLDDIERQFYVCA